MHTAHKNKKLIVSAIVPILNEERTIVGVVESLLASSYINEVICVNDGSSDRSIEALRPFLDRIVLLDFKKNKGKGFALASGIEAAHGDTVCFFDGDITNMQERFIETLLKPLYEENELIGVLGAPYRYRISLYFPLNIYLSGQRAYRKKYLEPHLKEIAAARFGVEVLLNSFFPKDKIKLVYLKGFYSLAKYNKMNVDEAIMSHVKALYEVSMQKGKIVFKPYIKYYPSELRALLNQEIKWEDYVRRIKDLNHLKNLLK